MICFNCGTTIELEDKVYRQSTCPKCGSYLHCCLNCRFYDEVAYQQCREPEARFVKEKEKANFCNYFEPAEGRGRPDTSRADDARKKLEQMFKKLPPQEED